MYAFILTFVLNSPSYICYYFYVLTFTLTFNFLADGAAENE